MLNKRKPQVLFLESERQARRRNAASEEGIVS